MVSCCKAAAQFCEPVTDQRHRTGVPKLTVPSLHGDSGRKGSVSLPSRPEERISLSDVIACKRIISDRFFQLSKVIAINEAPNMMLQESGEGYAQSIIYPVTSLTATSNSFLSLQAGI